MKRVPWLMLTALIVGDVTVMINSTMLRVAIPAMTAGLGVSFTEILWVLNAYLLVTVALVVPAGRLGDRYGPRAVFLTGMLLFLAGSAAGGFAGAAAPLIASRVVQGLGAALVIPQALALVRLAVPAERRGTVFGAMGAAAGLAVAIGPAVGGAIVTYLDWRWVFFGNLPLGVLVLVLMWLSAPRPSPAVSAGTPARYRPDLAGTGLLAGALLLLTYGLIELDRSDWAPVAMVASCGVFGLFLLVERGRQHREPLLPFAILRHRGFVDMCVVGAVLTCAVGGMALPTLLYLQSTAGMTAFGSGLVVALPSAVSVPFAYLSGRLTDRCGPRPALVVGVVLMTGGLAYLPVAVGLTHGWPALVPGLVVFGLGMGVVFAPPGVLLMRDIEPAMAGAAAGVSTTTRLVGGGIVGTVGVGALLQVGTGGSLESASPDELVGAVQLAYLLPIALLAIATLVSVMTDRRPPTRIAGFHASIPIPPPARTVVRLPDPERARPIPSLTGRQHR